MAPWKAVRAGPGSASWSRATRARAPRPGISRPESSTSQAASATHCALPGSAMPTSEAPTNTLVSADGPTDRRVELLKSTAARAGRKAAYKPVTSGIPARPA